MKFWKRFGGYMPILATIVVVGCVGDGTEKASSTGL